MKFVNVTFDGDFENYKSENELGIQSENILSNDTSSSGAEIGIFDSTKVNDIVYDLYEAGCDLGEIHGLDEAMADRVDNNNLDHNTIDNTNDSIKENELNVEGFSKTLSKTGLKNKLKSKLKSKLENKLNGKSEGNLNSESKSKTSTNTKYESESKFKNELEDKLNHKTEEKKIAEDYKSHDSLENSSSYLKSQDSLRSIQPTASQNASQDISRKAQQQEPQDSLSHSMSESSLHHTQQHAHHSNQRSNQNFSKNSSQQNAAKNHELKQKFESILVDFPNGAGDYLKYTKVYDDIIEIRHKILSSNDLTITNSSSLNVLSDSNKKSHWNNIEKICTKALSSQTKDLQIIVWFLEAVVYQHEVYYFYEYLSGFLAFIQKFWNEMYPDSNRDFILEWMDKNIVSAVNKTRITVIDDYQVSFSFLDVIIARKLNNVEKMSSIQNLIHKTDMNFYLTLKEHLEKAQEKIHEINKFLKDMSIIYLNTAIGEFIGFVDSIIFEKNKFSEKDSDMNSDDSTVSDSDQNDFDVYGLNKNVDKVNKNVGKEMPRNANDLIELENDNESSDAHEVSASSKEGKSRKVSGSDNSKYSEYSGDSRDVNSVKNVVSKDARDDDRDIMNAANTTNEMNLYISDYLQQKKSSLNVGDAILAQYKYWKDKDISKLIFEYQYNPQEMLTIMRFLGLLKNVGDNVDDARSDNYSKNVDIGQGSMTSGSIAAGNMASRNIGRDFQNKNAQQKSQQMKSYGEGDLENYSDVESYEQSESDISEQDDDLKLDPITGEHYSEAVSRKGLMDFMKRRGIGKYGNGMNGSGMNGSGMDRGVNRKNMNMHDAGVNGGVSQNDDYDW